MDKQISYKLLKVTWKIYINKLSFQLLWQKANYSMCILVRVVDVCWLDSSGFFYAIFLSKVNNVGFAGLELDRNWTIQMSLVWLWSVTWELFPSMWVSGTSTSYLNSQSCWPQSVSLNYLRQCYPKPKLIEALPWQVKLYSVRQRKLTKGTVLAGQGEKELRKRDGQVGPVNPFPPRGSPLTSNIVWC